MATKTLSVVISGDAAGAQKAFQQTNTGAEGLASKMEAAGKKMATVGKNLTLGITLPVAGLAAVGFKELEESGKVAAQTAAAIKSTGGAANVTAKQVDGLAQSLLNKSGIDDEAIKSGENLLLTFTSIRNEAGKGNDIFNQATKAALDLSVAFGKDMTQSAVLVGKALNDPIKGITALSRVGVSFTQAQKDMIKSLVESGDVMGAQKVILKELNTEVGGSAKAYGDTMAGQVSKAKEELNNAAAAMVTVAAPAVKFLGDRAMELAGFLNDLSPGAKTAVAAFAGVAAAIGPVVWIGGKLISTVNGIIKAWNFMADAFVAAERGIVNTIIRLQEMNKLSALAVVGIPLVGAAIALAFDQTIGEGANGAFPTLMKNLDGAKAKAYEWSQSIISEASASESPIASLTAGLNSLRASRDAELAAIRNGAGTQEQGIAVASKYHMTIDAVKLALQGAKVEHEKAVAAQRAQYDALVQLAAGETNLASTTDAGRKAIQDFNSALLAGAGGPIAYAQSVANQNKAQEDLNKAIADYGPGSAEATAASLALQQAQLGVSQAASSMDQAQANLTQQLVKGNTTYDQQIALLYQQLQLHPENAAGIQLEKEALDRAKAAADAIPGSKTVRVNADTSEFYSAIQGVESTIASASNSVVNVFVDTIHREFFTK